MWPRRAETGWGGRAEAMIGLPGERENATGQVNWATGAVRVGMNQTSPSHSHPIPHTLVACTSVLH